MPAEIRSGTLQSATGRHEDIMLIFETAGGLRAPCADVEDHSINYAVTPTTEPKGAAFLSDSIPGTPRFRLTHHLPPDGSLNTIFAMAPPGSSELKTYVEGAVKRR